MRLTPEMCRTARAMLGIGIRDLAQIAEVSPNTIARLERGENMHPRTLAHIQGVLEAERIQFIEDDKPSIWGGPGIRRSGSSATSSRGKLFEALWDGSDTTFTIEKAYVEVLGFLDRYLDIIETEDRQPDTWERLYLHDMVTELYRGSVYSADILFRMAITPPDNQSYEYRISDMDTDSVNTYDLRHFRRCADALRARGYFRT